MMKKDERNKKESGIRQMIQRIRNSRAENKGILSGFKKITKKKHKTSSHDEETLKRNEAKSAFRQLTGWEDDESVNVSLRTIIGGDILAGRWFRKHLAYLFFLVFLAILYVTNRYAYQNEMIDNRKLTLKLEDRRLRAVVATSNLSEYTRRSNISRQLSDTTLKSSPEPFYYLQTD